MEQFYNIPIPDKFQYQISKNLLFSQLLANYKKTTHYHKILQSGAIFKASLRLVDKANTFLIQRASVRTFLQKAPTPQKRVAPTFTTFI